MIPIKYYLFVLLSALSAGLFFDSLLSALSIQIPALATYALLIIIYFAVWLAYSKFISRITGAGFDETMKRDSLTYLPSLLLGLFALYGIFAPLEPMRGLDIAALATNMFAKLLLSLSLALILAMKIFYFPKTWLEGRLKAFRISPFKLLLLSMLIYFAVFSSLSYLQFATYNSPPPDLWVFDQSMWNSLNGSFMFNTRTNMPLLGDHFFLILVLLLPIYALWQSPIILFLIQTFFIALAALPIFWIARDKFNSEKAGLALALAYLLMPAIQFVNLSEFQPVALAIPFLLFAFYFLTTKRHRLFWLSTALALLCMETVAFVVFFLGIYAFWIMGRRKQGIAIMAVALLWIYIIFLLLPASGIVQPNRYFGGAENSYANLGSSFGEIIGTIVFNPLLVLSEVFTLQKIGYLLLVLSSTGFASLFSLPTLLISFPIFAQNLLSSKAIYTTIYAQYVSLIIPFLMVATIYGSRFLHWLLDLYGGTKNALSAVLAFVLLSALLSNVFFSPSPLSLLDPMPIASTFNPEKYTITKHHRLIDEAVAMVPANASVSADAMLLSHLSGRAVLDRFPKIDRAEYVLVDRSNPLNSSGNEDIGTLAQMLTDIYYSQLVNEDGVILFRKMERRR